MFSFMCSQKGCMGRFQALDRFNTATVKVIALPFCLCRYTVMSGTPEKLLEHLLETVKLDSNGNDAIGGSLQAHPRPLYRVVHKDQPWSTVCCLFISLQIPAWATFCSPIKFSCPPASCVLHCSTNILSRPRTRVPESTVEANCK